MKKIAVLLSLAMLFSLAASPMGGPPPNVVVLTAGMVASAADIESAIETATSSGTRPGVVILDGAEGDFVYTGDDRSINIAYSNFRLQGRNNAVISNCADGVYFDAVRANRVTIAWITFVCDNLGVYGGTGHHGVMLYNNTFTVGSFAVEAVEAKGWMIVGNRALSPDYVVFLTRSSYNRVVSNRLEGYVGVFLDDSNHNNVVNNRIFGAWHGVYLGTNASYNRVIANWIRDTEHAGITFGGGNEYNRVHANWVWCTDGVTCQLFDVEIPPLSTTNKIGGNRLIE